MPMHAGAYEIYVARMGYRTCSWDRMGVTSAVRFFLFTRHPQSNHNAVRAINIIHNMCAHEWDTSLPTSVQNHVEVSTHNQTMRLPQHVTHAGYILQPNQITHVWMMQRQVWHAWIRGVVVDQDQALETNTSCLWPFCWTVFYYWATTIGKCDSEGSPGTA